MTRRTLNPKQLECLILPERCDGNGNLYLRIGSNLYETIRKINSEGKRVATIPSGELPGASHPRLGSFNVDANGNVYQLASVQLASTEVGRYVFVFDSTGEFKSKAKLDPGFDWLPAHLASFPSGDLLVSGVRIHLESGEQTRRPFTGIFSSDGTFRKEVTLPDDQKLHDLGESGDAHLTSPAGPVNNRAFSFGSAESASDGNVYLLRAADPLIIYAISPGGEVSKRFVVDSGDASFSVLEPLHILGSRIAILFHNDQNGADNIKIVNTDGDLVATYNTPSGEDSSGPGLACWTAPDQFAFLGESDDGHLSIRYFQPR